MAIVQEAHYGASLHARAGPSHVRVFVSSPSTQSERTVSTSETVAELKHKLAVVTGIPAHSQRLTLHGRRSDHSTYEFTEGEHMAALDNDSKCLADYGIAEDCIIKVVPVNTALGDSLYKFVEDPNVKKYELTDEEYASRRDTVMAYKARNKIGRFADSDPNTADPALAALEASLVPGTRVKVTPSTPKEIERIGTVRYLGPTRFAAGTWVGVQYDEPVGKNDGSVDGKRYFDCTQKYGGFVKVERCVPGDWKSLDDELDFDSD